MACNLNFDQNFELEITLNYFFELELSLIQSFNYSETYFQLDSEEATYCDHCHLICCVYIKGHVEMVNTKDQSNAIVYCACYVVCRQCQHIQSKTIKMFGGASLSHCMQHVSTVSTYPGSHKSCFSHIPVFGRKVFLIFPIIY